ncbi:MAG: AAC(3) family N-acetyltransferase [Proteobacteria bacterium]|nr:AAC(3) family N-acetyltransferase [Pseudomonadota bacterium]
MSLRSIVRRALGEANVARLRIAAGAAREIAATYRPKPVRYPVPVARIAPALRELGVREGDTLHVHSSNDALRAALPAPEGGVDPGALAYAISVVGALRHAVGPRGTVVMPTDGLPRGVFKFARERKIFDPRKAPSNRGLITEVFRRSSGALRSDHPWYNVTAQGPGAESLIAEAALAQPYAMDARSPWWRLVERDAKVALLGVDYEINSLIHLIEYMHPDEFPEPVFIEKPLRMRFARSDGTVGEIDVKMHCNRYRAGDPTWFQRRLQEKYGLFRETAFGSAPLIVFEARRLYESMLAEMREGRTWYDAIYER